MTFLKKFGIQVDRSSHRASNYVERWHKTEKKMLKLLCLENGSSWEKKFHFALLTLRTVTVESTSFSPAELKHGKNLRTLETLLYKQWTKTDEAKKFLTEYVFDLLNRIKRCQKHYDHYRQKKQMV